MGIKPPTTPRSENVVTRLKRRIEQAKAAGFDVRLEHLGEGEAGWCQVDKSRLLFLDVSQTAADQLDQLNEALQSFEQESSRIRVRPAKVA